jgi:hypothetical protein
MNRKERSQAISRIDGIIEALRAISIVTAGYNPVTELIISNLNQKKESIDRESQAEFEDFISQSLNHFSNKLDEIKINQSIINAKKMLIYELNGSKLYSIDIPIPGSNSSHFYYVNHLMLSTTKGYMYIITPPWSPLFSFDRYEGRGAILSPFDIKDELGYLVVDTVSSVSRNKIDRIFHIQPELTNYIFDELNETGNKYKNKSINKPYSVQYFDKGYFGLKTTSEVDSIVKEISEFIGPLDYDSIKLPIEWTQIIYLKNIAYKTNNILKAIKAANGCVENACEFLNLPISEVDSKHKLHIVGDFYCNDKAFKSALDYVGTISIK